MKSTNTNAQNPTIRVAAIISLVTNPPLLSVLVMFLISVTKSGPVSTLAGWWIEVVAFLVLLPVVYLYIRAAVSKSQIKFPLGIIGFLKQHPLDVLVMSIVFGIPCMVILTLFQAPPMMYGTLAALLITSIIIATVYKFYRVSYHVAATIILVTMTIITWGNIYSWLVVLVPIVGWAKYRLQEHSVAQMLSAAALSASVTTVTLWVIGIF